MTHSPENLANQSSSESAGGGWDELAEISFRGGVIADEAEHKKPQSEQPSPEAKQEKLRERVRDWGKIYCDTENDFAKYAETADRSTPEGREKYKTTLSKYEDEIAWDWDNLHSSINAAKSKGAIKGYYEEAAASRVGGDGSAAPEKSVEAACGTFYDERANDLVARIDSDESLSDEERATQRKLVGQTWRKVMNYLDAVRDMETQHDDPRAYERARNYAHNNMIHQLNDLNDLARQHQTKPFTPRNFFDGNVPYKSYLDHHESLRNRAEYDRDTVASYFYRVFTNDFNRADRETLKNSNLY